MAKRGAPELFTQELADQVCFQLSLGKSLRTVCQMPDMPAGTTVFKWLRTMPEFAKQYARAKEEGADAMFEELNDIADDTLQVIKKGAEKKSGAYAQAQRIRIDTRKWYLSKVKPKKYGDKLDVTSDGKPLPTPIYGGRSTKPQKD